MQVKLCQLNFQIFLVIVFNYIKLKVPLSLEFVFICKSNFQDYTHCTRKNILLHHQDLDHSYFQSSALQKTTSILRQILQLGCQKVNSITGEQLLLAKVRSKVIWTS